MLCIKTCCRSVWDRVDIETTLLFILAANVVHVIATFCCGCFIATKPWRLTAAFAALTWLAVANVWAFQTLAQDFGPDEGVLAVAICNILFVQCFVQTIVFISLFTTDQAG